MTFYSFGRIFVRFILNQFFRRIDILGESIEKEGAVIFVSNHPNMMVDALLVVASVEREIWFLAKSTLFKGALKSFILDFLHFIPLYRKMDGADTSANNESFAKVGAKLLEGKAILIFPEGTSIGGRALLSFKTGAARMGFQAEDESKFVARVKIQPVGITYSNPIEFKSTVSVTFGKPVVLGDFKEAYVSDPKGTVKEVTQFLEQELKALTIDLPEGKETVLIEKIRALYGPHLNDFTVFSTITKNVKALLPFYPAYTRDLERRLDEVLVVPDTGSKGENFPNLLLAFPLAVVMLLHYVPFILVRKLSRWASSDNVEVASNKLTFGLFIFPMWYILLSFLTFASSQNIVLAVGVLIFFISYGVLASTIF
jgi:glycerol-3-phosphate O-acyltransferase / dihydroxyacetone phosphate acyltransferase